MDYPPPPPASSSGNASFGYDGGFDAQDFPPSSSFPPDAPTDGGGGGGGGGSGGGGGGGREMIQNTVSQGLEQFKSAGSHLADVTHLNDPETKMAATR